jgi:ribosome recycling factor
MTDTLNAFKDKCKKSVDHFKEDLGKVRSGRANASVLNDLQVEYYGSHVPLQQLGMINTPEARLITVQIYDAGALDAVEKAIRSADLGFNPAREGSLLRIVVPALTEERRKEIVKSLSRMAEDAKVVLRNLRRDELDVLKKKEKNKEISADDLKRAQEAVQKVVDAFVVDIDKLLQAKEKEVMAV